VPSDQQTQSRTSHPVLGPGIAVYDNRGRTRLRLAVWIAMVPLGLFGVWLGRGDVAGGSTLPGIAQALAGFILATYSARAAVVDIRRLAIPIRMVVARDGLALVPGDRTITWDEVDSVRDPRAPEGQPRTLRIHLSNPGEFERQHALSIVARLALRVNRGDLLLGAGTAMPVVKAEALMRTQLADFRRRESASEHAPVRPRAARGRRPEHKR
jgi:hypothetical protein